MDVGNPSNFVRILDLFENNHAAIRENIAGFAFTDQETRAAMQKVYGERGYILDPHGAVGYLGLVEYQKVSTEFTGIFLETAHPAKFKEVVEDALQTKVLIPQPLQKFLTQTKETSRMGSDFESFKTFLQDTL
jgi:threonine synthase